MKKVKDIIARLPKELVVGGAGFGVLILAVILVYVFAFPSSKAGTLGTTSGSRAAEISTIESKNSEKFEVVSSENDLESTIKKYHTYDVTLKDKHLNTVIDETAATKVDVATLNELNITKKGTYILSGTSADFHINVDVSEDEEVKLVLNNVNLTAKESSVILANSVDHLILIAQKGTTNSISQLASSAEKADGEDSEEGDEKDGAIYSSDDLVIIGEGKLTVNNASGKGIRSKGDINLKIANLEVTATGTAIKASDSLFVLGGEVTASAGNDGLRANDDLVVTGGKVTVTKSVEGFEASRISILGGEIDVTSSDDALNASDKTVESSDDDTADVQQFGGQSGGQFGGGGMPDGQMQPPGGQSDGTHGDWGSRAGAGGMPNGASGGGGRMGGRGGGEAVMTGIWIYITSGTIKLGAQNDGIDSNGHICITGGVFDITTRSKGQIIAQGDGPIDANGFVILKPEKLVANGTEAKL